MARDIEREQENGKRILLGGYTTWKHLGEEFVRVPAISVACVRTHVYGADAPTGKYIRGPSSFVK